MLTIFKILGMISVVCYMISLYDLNKKSREEYKRIREEIKNERAIN